MIDKLIAYYDKNGVLYDVYPRNKETSLYDDRQTAYNATVVSVNGALYDLTTASGFCSLPIPDFKASWDILNLAYIMKMYCGTINDPDVVPAAVSKTLALMRASSMLYRRRDYLQVIRNYYRVGLFTEGEAFECAYRKDHPTEMAKPEDEAHEKEHTCTKAYFKRKWEKKHASKT